MDLENLIVRHTVSIKRKREKRKRGVGGGKVPALTHLNPVLNKEKAKENLEISVTMAHLIKAKVSRLCVSTYTLQHSSE